MTHELTKTEENKIALLDRHELSDVIKPLHTEIHLFDTFIAGTLQMNNKEILDNLEIGKKLVLKRHEAVYDSYAIDIFNENGEKLGYIPEKDNVVFARLMDAGKRLIGKVADIQPKPSMKIVTVGIYLVDF